MPIAEFHSYPKNPALDMTALEQQHARLIGALMACAKHLQIMRKCVANGDADQGATCAVEMMVCLDRLFDSDGKRMEAESLALAKRLGFDVELYVVPPSSGVSH